MAAQVSGDFGGILGDIPSGSFSNSSQLSIETSGGNVVFFSDTFLTQVPEPEIALGLAAALLALAGLRRGYPRPVGSRALPRVAIKGHDRP